MPRWQKSSINSEAWVVLNFPHISGLLGFANCSSKGFKKEVIERTEAYIFHFNYNIWQKETIQNIEPLLHWLENCGHWNPFFWLCGHCLFATPSGSGRTPTPIWIRMQIMGISNWLENNIEHRMLYSLFLDAVGVWIQIHFIPLPTERSTNRYPLKQMIPPQWDFHVVSLQIWIHSGWICPIPLSIFQMFWLSFEL